MTQITTFGTTQDNHEVTQIEISSDQLTVKILTFGAVINDVRLTGVSWPLTLGSPDISAYERSLGSFGSLMGPVINRIKGCSAKIDGQIYNFEKYHSGKLTQHSGSTGMQKQVWRVTDYGTNFLVLKLTLPNGLGGFPGNRQIEVRYTVMQSTLIMTVHATTDATTVFNPANHSYWSLDPKVGFKDQVLQVSADRFTEPDDALMPTGRVLSVLGTQYDFQNGIKMAGDASQFFDFNLCLTDRRRPLQKIATLTGTHGVSMDLATTECGLQVYDCGTINAPQFKTHHDVPYGPYSGLALEAQSWPGSLAHSHFPSIYLRPHTQYEQVTSWTFSKEKLG